MLRWIIGFAILALVAAVFGFGGIAASFAGIAKILFFVFIGLVVLTAVIRTFRGKSPA